MDKMLHIIPAAGKASRIGGIPKFLLPIASDNFLIKFHSNLVNNVDTHVHKAIVVSSEYFETVKRLELNAEIFEANTSTMNETVAFAIDRFPEINNYLLTMPDTFFNDSDVIENLVEKFVKSNVDISLGLWKIQNYQKGKLGQVLVKDGEITDAVDKDKNCKYQHAWGAIAWNSSANKLINVKESHIGYIIKPALENRYKINYEIADNKYYDCGTFDEYLELLRFKK